MPFNFSTNLAIPLSSSIARDDPAALNTAKIEINQILNGLRSLAQQLDNLTGNAFVATEDQPGLDPAVTYVGGSGFRAYLQAGEDIPNGNFVGIQLNSQLIYRANCSNAQRLACGYNLNGRTIAAGEWASWNLGPGINYALSGLAPGRWYFISASSGLLQTTQPFPGQYTQVAGIAINDHELLVGSLNNWYLT
jgi:hypothetical protein